MLICRWSVISRSQQNKQKKKTKKKTAFFSLSPNIRSIFTQWKQADRVAWSPTTHPARLFSMSTTFILASVNTSLRVNKMWFENYSWKLSERSCSKNGVWHSPTDNSYSLKGNHNVKVSWRFPLFAANQFLLFTSCLFSCRCLLFTSCFLYKFTQHAAWVSHNGACTVNSRIYKFLYN